MKEKLAVVVGIAVFAWPALGGNLERAAVTPVIIQAQRGPKSPAPAQAAISDAPRCTTVKSEKITITCDYMEAVPSKCQAEIRVALDHALLSFKTKGENYMQVELTFTNRGTSPILSDRKVYLEIDDAEGHNYMRRSLPSVDFPELMPGQKVAFSVRLLSGTFRPGHYSVNLWIPNADRALKFKPGYNLLLCSKGVPDHSTGLNRVAEFTVERVSRKESSPE